MNNEQKNTKIQKYHLTKLYYSLETFGFYCILDSLGKIINTPLLINLHTPGRI